jgi:hypothetical protein
MKYCISWLSFFSNDIESKVVEAGSELEALSRALNNLMSTENEVFESPKFPTSEAYKQYAFDCDGAINALCIEEA